MAKVMAMVAMVIAGTVLGVMVLAEHTNALAAGAWAMCAYLTADVLALRLAGFPARLDEYRRGLVTIAGIVLLGSLVVGGFR